MATGLVVDTDVASYIFKWRPVFASQYAPILCSSQLMLSFMSVAEMRQGALDANWGLRQRNLLEAYLRSFSACHLMTCYAPCGPKCGVRAEAKDVLSVQQMLG